MKEAVKKSAGSSGIMTINKNIAADVEKLVQKYVSDAMQQGVDLNTLGPEQLKMIVAMNAKATNRVISGSSAEGRAITEKLFGKQKAPVVDINTGKTIDTSQGIMGGKSVKELMESGQVQKGTDGLKKGQKITDRDMFNNSSLNKVDTVTDTITYIKTLDPMDAMKEANSVIGRKGKYKNLTPEESKKILTDTEDHIFERDILIDPDDMAKGGRAGYAVGNQVTPAIDQRMNLDYNTLVDQNTAKRDTQTQNRGIFSNMGQRLQNFGNQAKNYLSEQLTTEKIIPGLQPSIDNLQNVINSSTDQNDYFRKSTSDMIQKLSEGYGKAPIVGPLNQALIETTAPVLSAVTSPFYDGYEAYKRMEPGSGISGFAKAFDNEQPLDAIANRFIGAAEPLANRITNVGTSIGEGLYGLLNPATADQPSAMPQGSPGQLNPTPQSKSLQERLGIPFKSLSNAGLSYDEAVAQSEQQGRDSRAKISTEFDDYLNKQGYQKYLSDRGIYQSAPAIMERENKLKQELNRLAGLDENVREGFGFSNILNDQNYGREISGYTGPNMMTPKYRNLSSEELQNKLKGSLDQVYNQYGIGQNQNYGYDENLTSGELSTLRNQLGDLKKYGNVDQDYVDRIDRFLPGTFDNLEDIQRGLNPNRARFDSSDPSKQFDYGDVEFKQGYGLSGPSEFYKNILDRSQGLPSQFQGYGKNLLKQLQGLASGGRAGYYGGGPAMVGEDLSEIGHGSDSLMARNMQLAPNGQATTSTGLNYLLGQDNDTVRVPYAAGGGGRRAFLKMLGLAGAGVAGVKSGIIGLGEGGAKKAVTETVKQAIPGGDVPPYFLKLVSKIKKLGDDVTETGALADRQTVKRYKDFELTEDLSTGRIEIQRYKVSDEASYYGQPLTEETYMGYSPGETIIGKGNKPIKTKPEYQEGTTFVRNDGRYTGEVVDESTTIADDIFEEVGEKLPEAIRKTKAGDRIYKDRPGELAEGGRIGFSAGGGKFLLSKLGINPTSRKFLEKVFGKQKFNTMIQNDPRMHRGMLEVVEMFRNKDKDGLKSYMKNFLPEMSDVEMEKFIVSSGDSAGIEGQLIRLGSGREYKNLINMKKEADQIRKLDDFDIEDVSKNAEGGRIGFSGGGIFRAIIAKSAAKKGLSVRDFIKATNYKGLPPEVRMYISAEEFAALKGGQKELYENFIDMAKTRKSFQEQVELGKGTPAKPLFDNLEQTMDEKSFVPKTVTSDDIAQMELMVKNRFNKGRKDNAQGGIQTMLGE